MRGLLAFLAVLLLAGCLEPSAPAATEQPDEGAGAGDGNEGRTARAGGRGGAGGDEEEPAPTLLGRATGGESLPGRVTFTVTIPPGGARDVEWGLVVRPVGTTTDSIEGPGCSSSGGSVTIVGSHTQTDGSCQDLKEGEHEFTVVLQGPVLNYDAQVIGVLEDPAGPSPSGSAHNPSNATER